MPLNAPTRASAEPFRRLAIGFAALAAPVAIVAGRHLELTLRYGPICGPGAGGHCWACHAAALLAAAALASWAISARLAALAHVRA